MDELSKEIAQTARNRLERCAHAQLRNVRCEFDHSRGVLTLRGHVSSYYLKQLAQATVADVEAVECIENLLEVDSSVQ